MKKTPFNLTAWLKDKSQKVVWSDGTPAPIEDIELHFLLNTNDLFLVTEGEGLAEPEGLTDEELIEEEINFDAWKDVDEAAEKYATEWHNGTLELFPTSAKRAFKAGAELQKKQMMKDVVAVQVVGEQRDLRLIDSTQRCLFNFERGDWLNIIIVKEDNR